VIKMGDRLATELATLDRDLHRLVAAAVPTLCALKGVGTDVAGAVLVAAGDNPERLRSEGAFANPCGVAPLPSRLAARRSAYGRTEVVIEAGRFDESGPANETQRPEGVRGSSPREAW
jgi:transposase